MMCLSCFAFVSCSPKDILANLHLGRNTDSSGYDHDMSVLGYENKHQVCSFLVMHSLLNPASRWLKETGSFICCFFFFFSIYCTALLLYQTPTEPVRLWYAVPEVFSRKSLQVPLSLIVRQMYLSLVLHGMVLPIGWAWIKLLWFSPTDKFAKLTTSRFAAYGQFCEENYEVGQLGCFWVLEARMMVVVVQKAALVHWRRRRVMQKLCAPFCKDKSLHCPEKCSEMAVESMLGCATAICLSGRFFPFGKSLEGGKWSSSPYISPWSVLGPCVELVSLVNGT